MAIRPKYIVVLEGIYDVDHRFGERGPGRPPFPGLDQAQIVVKQMIAGYKHKQLIERVHEKSDLDDRITDWPEQVRRLLYGTEEGSNGRPSARQ